jgi:hypothetical protein
MTRILRISAFALALGLGVWTLAVTFTPISSAFQAGQEVSAAAFNALFGDIDANFDAAAIAIDQNAADIVDLQNGAGIVLPFAGSAASSDAALSISNTDTGIGLLGTSDTRAIVGTQGSTSCAGTYAVGGCATTGTGVSGSAAAGIGVFGTSDNRGVVGTQGSTSCGGTYGVGGCAAAGIGVFGTSGTRAIVGTQGSTSCAGTYAVGGCATTGTGVFGSSSSGLAGSFSGNVDVSGTLSKGAGSFLIDHPLDPENMTLSHSFVESPDMMNIYNGNVELDGDGTAVVAMPNWFEALNMEFRYQLTAVGAPGPNLYIAQTVQDNRFAIAGGAPGMLVSWQVTGIRHDPFAELHRIQVEVEKPLAEQGTYLHPEAYGNPAALDATLVPAAPASAN